MRYLVVSDSHGRDADLGLILSKEKNNDGIIYLGDGIRDILFPSPETFGKAVYSVKSMRDPVGADRPYELVLTLDGIKVYLCHGDHLYTDVKLGFASLINKGIYHGAQICFFGHTHKQTLLETDGLTLFNPGAAKDGEYGIFETKNGAFTLLHRRI